MLEEADKEKLATHPANAILELQALAAGQRVQDVVKPISQMGLTPIFTSETIFDDIQLVVGAQEAQFGGISKPQQQKQALLKAQECLAWALTSMS